AELRDRGADLDIAGPAQLAQEIDLGVDEHVGAAGHADAEIGPAKHGDPAGLEIGREYRVVDVSLRVEIGVADDIAGLVRVVVEPRLGPACWSGLVVHGTNSSPRPLTGADRLKQVLACLKQVLARHGVFREFTLYPAG